eukprot:1246545-Rhodomonas_salina.2
MCDEDVVGLDVAVDDGWLARVEVVQSGSKLLAPRKRTLLAGAVRLAEALLLEEHIVERTTVDVLEHNHAAERLAGADAQSLHQVWVPQLLRNNVHFLVEVLLRNSRARALHAPVCQEVAQHLDGNILVLPPRSDYQAHCAFAHDLAV